MPKLVDGSINAVLSSGDGGAGRELWKFLPYFSEITYSLPLSVAVVSQALYDGLSPELREAVDTASRQTEDELWLAMPARQQENYRRMRENGVTIETGLAPAVIAALQSGAPAAQRAWCATAEPACLQVLEAFKAGKP
jgi:TRAP-type C4-dicarboxylate transport system substrate-binding protein